MTQSQQQVSDLTLDELVGLIRSVVREALDEGQGLPATERQSHPQAGILDIAPVSVGEWTPGLKLISREEYYA